MAAAMTERLNVREAAVVFATRTQLLEAVITLPEQLRQLKGVNYHNGDVGGHFVFTPRAGKDTVHGLKAKYYLPLNLPQIAPSDSTTPTFALEINNWQGMGDDKLRKASDEILRGGKPARVITELPNTDVIRRFGVDFFSRLLSTGYRPEHATFYGLRTRLGNIGEVTLIHKGVALEPEVPILAVGRKGHANQWVERVIQKYGAVPTYDCLG